MRRIMEWCVPNDAFQPTLWDQLRLANELVQLGLKGLIAGNERIIDRATALSDSLDHTATALEQYKAWNYDQNAMWHQ
jgi:hypothetical protein